MSAVTRFLPLTYLADSVQAVATAGAGIGDISTELIGLAAWLAVAFAIQLFRWE